MVVVTKVVFSINIGLRSSEFKRSNRRLLFLRLAHFNEGKLFYTYLQGYVKNLDTVRSPKY